MEKLYKIAEGLFKRYPNGVEPFQIMTRLLEECGEVASEVNHFENSGVKIQKHGKPNKQNLANEIKQSLVALMQLALYYNIEKELAESIDESIEKLIKKNLI